MKKFILYLSILSFSLILFACSSKSEVSIDPDKCTYPDDGKTLAPGWICDQPVEGVAVSEVGIASPTKAGIDFQKTMAASSAREKLASRMKIKIKGMVKRFIETTGIGDAETVDKVNTSVTKQITNETLVGTRIFRTRKNPNTGYLYLLMGLDTEGLQQSAQAAVSTSMKNDQALWQKFQASKAQDELAAEISQMK